MENVVLGEGLDGVSAINQLGYIVTAPPQTPLPPDQYATMLGSVGPLGGLIDCTINLGGSRLLFRVTHIGVGATDGLQFSMAAWGSPVFPGGGQWSTVQMVDTDPAPQAVNSDTGVPVIRQGAVDDPGPFSTHTALLPHPIYLNVGAPSVEYGILHSTGTQRVLFCAPKLRPLCHSH